MLLIIEVMINVSLGFDNTDYKTNKLKNVHASHCMYSYALHCTIRTRAQLVKRYYPQFAGGGWIPRFFYGIAYGAHMEQLLTLK